MLTKSSYLHGNYFKAREVFIWIVELPQIQGQGIIEDLGINQAAMVYYVVFG